MTEPLSDEVLKQIAEGNGHVYRHEGKSMAQELIALRARVKAGTMPAPAAAGNATSSPWNGIP